MSKSDKGVSGEVILRSGAETAALDLSSGIFRAVFDSVVSPRNVYTSSRRRARKFTENDIAQLCRLLEQWSRSYRPESYKLSIFTVFESKDRVVVEDSVTFEDVEQFLQQAPEHPGSLRYIAIVISFSIISEDKASLEVHSAEIVLNGTVEAVADAVTAEDELGTPPYMRERENWSLISSISYSNYLVARALSNVIDEWYVALPRLDIKFRSGFTSRIFRSITAFDELHDWPWRVLIPLLYSVLVLFAAEFYVFPILGYDASFGLYAGIVGVTFSIFSYVNSILFYRMGMGLYREDVTLSRINSLDREAQDSFMAGISAARDDRRYWERFFLAQFVLAAIGAGYSIFKYLFA